MSLTVDSNNTRAVINAQHNWLKTLQLIQPNKKAPIRVKVIEGNWPKGGDYDLYGWKSFQNIWYKVDRPIFTRGTLPNELLIDPDTPEWNVMKKGLDKLCNYCRENNIPFIAGYSGGKGVHISIFFKYSSLEKALFDGVINDDNVFLGEINLNKGTFAHDIDVFKTIRKALITALAEKIGLDLESIRLDWGKIVFSDVSKGSQVRTFGTMRAPGQYKTFLEEIPDHKPEPYEFSLIFPEKVNLWEIEGTEFEAAVIDALNKEVERAKKAKEYTFVDHAFNGTEIFEFPCIKKLFSIGVTNGRYYAGEGVLLLCKKCGISKEKTEQYMRELFKTFPAITQAETDIRINNALPLYDTDKNFSCRVLKEHFPNYDLCKFSECVMKTIADEREQLEASRTEMIKSSCTKNAEAEDELKEMTHGEIELLKQGFAARRLTLNLPDDHAITQVVKYLDRMTDGYSEFKVLGAFFLLSACTQRKPIIDLSTTVNGVFTNLWAQFLGISTISRKTTVQDFIIELLSYAMHKELTDIDPSMEAYLEGLSLNPVQPMPYDEVSSLFQKMAQKYNSGYFEFECKIYDCKSHEKRLASGGKKEPRTFPIKNPFVTKLYGTTFVKYKRSMTIPDFDSGYGYRFLYAAPTYDFEERPPHVRTPEDIEARSQCEARIAKLYDFFTQAPVFALAVNPDAMEYYNQICLETSKKIKTMPFQDLLGSAWGRYQIYIMKFAALIELGKATVSRNISLESIKIASNMILDYFLPTLCDVYNLLTVDPRNNKIDKIIEALKEFKGVVNHTDLLRKVRLESKEFQSLISTMVESKQIELISEKNPTNCKLTRYYHLIDSDEIKLGNITATCKNNLDTQEHQTHEAHRLTYAGSDDVISVSLTNLTQLDLQNNSISQGNKIKLNKNIQTHENHNTNNSDCEPVSLVSSGTWESEKLETVSSNYLNSLKSFISNHYQGRQIKTYEVTFDFCQTPEGKKAFNEIGLDQIKKDVEDYSKYCAEMQTVIKTPESLAEIFKQEGF